MTWWRHRRDIHQRAVTLCGLAADRVVRDFTPSDCDECEAVQAILEARETEYLTPVQARQRLASQRAMELCLTCHEVHGPPATGGDNPEFDRLHEERMCALNAAGRAIRFEADRIITAMSGWGGVARPLTSVDGHLLDDIVRASGKLRVQALLVQRLRQ